MKHTKHAIRTETTTKNNYDQNLKENIKTDTKTKGKQSKPRKLFKAVEQKRTKGERITD